MATSAAAAVVGHRELALQSSDSASVDEVRTRTRRDLEKRARMASWGKREQAIDGLADLPMSGEFVPIDDEDDRDKRRGKMAAWGKKSVDGGVGRFAADKTTRSKWSSGNMSVWGKRSASGVDILDDFDTEKRSKWDSGNMAVWGKRDEDGKRGWHDKGSLAVWG